MGTNQRSSDGFGRGALLVLVCILVLTGPPVLAAEIEFSDSDFIPCGGWGMPYSTDNWYDEYNGVYRFVGRYDGGMFSVLAYDNQAGASGEFSGKRGSILQYSKGDPGYEIIEDSASRFQYIKHGVNGYGQEYYDCQVYRLYNEKILIEAHNFVPIIDPAQIAYASSRSVALDNTNRLESCAVTILDKKTGSISFSSPGSAPSGEQAALSAAAVGALIYTWLLLNGSGPEFREFLRDLLGNLRRRKIVDDDGTVLYSGVGDETAPDPAEGADTSPSPGPGDEEKPEPPGDNLDPEDGPEVKEEVPVVGYCTQCGNPLRPEDTFCRRCGMKMPGQSAAKQDPDAFPEALRKQREAEGYVYDEATDTWFKPPITVKPVDHLALELRSATPADTSASRQWAEGEEKHTDYASATAPLVNAVDDYKLEAHRVEVLDKLYDAAIAERERVIGLLREAREAGDDHLIGYLEEQKRIAGENIKKIQIARDNAVQNLERHGDRIVAKGVGASMGIGMHAGMQAGAGRAIAGVGKTATNLYVNWSAGNLPWQHASRMSMGGDGKDVPLGGGSGAAVPEGMDMALHQQQLNGIAEGGRLVGEWFEKAKGGGDPAFRERLVRDIQENYQAKMNLKNAPGDVQKMFVEEVGRINRRIDGRFAENLKNKGYGIIDEQGNLREIRGSDIIEYRNPRSTSVNMDRDLGWKGKIVDRNGRAIDLLEAQKAYQAAAKAEGLDANRALHEVTGPSRGSLHAESYPVREGMDPKSYLADETIRTWTPEEAEASYRISQYKANMAKEHLRPLDALQESCRGTAKDMRKLDILLERRGAVLDGDLRKAGEILRQVGSGDRSVAWGEARMRSTTRIGSLREAVEKINSLHEATVKLGGRG
jgi:hypothetical protein